MYILVLLTCLYLYHLSAWYPWKLGEGVGPSGTGVTDGYEPPCGCWELNLGPLEEQPGLLQQNSLLDPSETLVFI